jgi:hypothetical protein
VNVAGACALTALAAALSACGPSEPAPRAAAQPSYGDAPIPGAAFTSGTLAERYFPLVDGYVYSYATMSGNGDTGVLVSTAARGSPTHGELRSSAGARRFEYTPQGVVSAATGAFILKEPLVVGSSWRGEHGGVTRIEGVDLMVSVLGGTFKGCVRTIEERGGDVPARYDTTFCPDVGVVALEVASGMSLERAELKSYAPPVRIGPDGLVRTQ